MSMKQLKGQKGHKLPALRLFSVNQPAVLADPIPFTVNLTLLGVLVKVLSIAFYFNSNSSSIGTNFDAELSRDLAVSWATP